MRVLVRVCNKIKLTFRNAMQEAVTEKAPIQSKPEDSFHSTILELPGTHIHTHAHSLTHVYTRTHKDPRSHTSGTWSLGGQSWKRSVSARSWEVVGERVL